MSDFEFKTGKNAEIDAEIIKRREFAAKFAKELAQQRIHDPSGKTSKRQSKSFTTYSKENIESYLKSPASNEKNLRDSSIYMYHTNSRYRNLMHYYANVPKWYYTITPVGFNPEKVNAKSFYKQYMKTANVIETMGVVNSMKNAALIAIREGAFYGLIWGGDGNSFILQKMNPDNCHIVSITDGGVYQYSYDMSKVQEVDLPTYYPPQFTDMYNEYKRTGNQYQAVPLEIGFCLKGDPSVPDSTIPPFSGVLPGLFTIKNVEELSEAASELSNYKLLAGILPTDEEGVPLIDYPTAMDYYNHIAGNVGERVGVAISPFELKSYDFEQNGTTAQVNNVARANENFFASAGTSALLHGATNSTSGVTKLAIKVDEAFAFALMYQCGAVINRYLKTFAGNVKFKINFLPVSIFNESEMIDHYKSAMNYGMGKLQYAACVGTSQVDLLGQSYIENEILHFDEAFKPMKTAATRSSGDESTGGRPTSGDNDITDEGEQTRDNTTNDDR